MERTHCLRLQILACETLSDPYGTRDSKEVTVEGRVQFDLFQVLEAKAGFYEKLIATLDFASFCDGKFLVSLGSGLCRIWDVTSSKVVASLAKGNMRLTSPSPVYRGIFAMFLAGSRQVSGNVLKQHQERRLQQLLLKRQIVMGSVTRNDSVLHVLRTSEARKSISPLKLNDMAFLQDYCLYSSKYFVHVLRNFLIWS
ncbi:hypothetical protein J1N35_029060 [Gossypium stocksii]|uniref:Uncharacterized protein n=1 Tax=Gossypium stocksii TaxID=47602 RepID=A0A9D3ZSU1_9ROSI|nr:hypothetical protein J1N35_029060 [Gossypium stocksii]